MASVVNRPFCMAGMVFYSNSPFLRLLLENDKRFLFQKKPGFYSRLSRKIFNSRPLKNSLSS